MGKLKKIFEKNKDSLKVKLILYTMLILFIFIAIFEIFTFISLRNYYKNNLMSSMLEQARYGVELYQNNLSEFSLEDIVLNERLEFINNVQGQVQILNNTGLTLYDNSASNQVGVVDPNVDLENLSKNIYTFKTDIKNKTMTLYYPIHTNTSNNSLGYLKTISSLKNSFSEVNKRMAIFIVFGFLSLLLGFILTYLFENKFLEPIHNLTKLALKLSDGQYKEKSGMSYEGEIGELAKTMDKLSENIIKKEEIKTDFISSVSHELRTPLTSIKGWALTLQSGDLDKETNDEGLKIIEKEADRLSDMVEDLLDFSRFTSPKFSLSKNSVNMVPLVKNIVNQFKIRSNEKNIAMVYDYNVEEIKLIADENRLKQVFINLIDNAIKFTPNDGTIIVNTRLDNDKVICNVIDTGIGIGEDEIDLVTTKFYKGTTSASHTGLGLSICEEIILLHGGELNISSKINEGTNIEFTIPLGGDNEKNEI